MSATASKSGSGSSIKRKLSVSSARGNPDPVSGVTLFDDGAQVSCKIKNPRIDGTIVWRCIGWSGTGSAPLEGAGTDVTFPINADSSITWEGVGEPNPGQLVTLIALVLLAIVAVLSYVVLRSVFLTAVSVGAVGGVLHEVIQSAGKFVLPTWEENTQNFCLGGLVGIISGGLAGIVLVQGLTMTTLNHQLIALAFTAGIALKGVADAPNPGGKPSSAS